MAIALSKYPRGDRFKKIAREKVGKYFSLAMSGSDKIAPTQLLECGLQ